MFASKVSDDRKPIKNYFHTNIILGHVFTFSGIYLCCNFYNITIYQH